MTYTPIEDGLKKCVAGFMKDGCVSGGLNALSEAYFDKASHTRPEFSGFSGWKPKLKYIIARYTPYMSYKRIKNG